MRGVVNLGKNPKFTHLPPAQAELLCCIGLGKVSLQNDHLATLSEINRSAEDVVGLSFISEAWSIVHSCFWLQI